LVHDETNLAESKPQPTTPDPSRSLDSTHSSNSGNTPRVHEKPKVEVQRDMPPYPSFIARADLTPKKLLVPKLVKQQQSSAKSLENVQYLIAAFLALAISALIATQFYQQDQRISNLETKMDLISDNIMNIDVKIDELFGKMALFEQFFSSQPPKSDEKQVVCGPVVPVYEEKVDVGVSITEYLNESFKKYAKQNNKNEQDLKFVEYREGVSAKTGLYVVHFSRRLMKDQEEKIAQLKSAGLENVMLVTLHFNKPGNEIMPPAFPPSVSGFRCRDEEESLSLGLTYYLFSSGAQMLPSECELTKNADCDLHNPTQLKSFFDSLGRFFKKCV